MSPRDPELAILLKNEGNRLYNNKNYEAADVKYTKALELDDTNATFWANRAACRLNMRRFLDTISDGIKATELDSGYSKAYARIATAYDALGEPWNSTSHWKKALNSLRKEHLTSAEQNQRGEYEVALASAKRVLKAFEDSNNPESTTGPSHHGLVYSEEETKNLPWRLASEMLPQLTLERNQKSSAWLITSAYHEFNTGLDMLNSAFHSGHGNVVRVRLGVGSLLSDAVLKDPRCFHIDDPNFIKNYNNQVIAELESSGGRQFYAGPDVIMKEAPERLRRDGWSKLQSALNVTIRSWIMRGFIDGSLRDNHTIKMELLSSAVKVIKWGQKEWADVSVSDRGVMFQDSFLRGVQRLYFEAIIPPHDVEFRVSILKQMFEEADEVIKSVDSKPLPPYDGPEGPSWRMAFFDYPKADAYAAKGRYYSELGYVCCVAAEKSILYEKSGEMYVLAADCLPEDDEVHALYLTYAMTEGFITSQVQISTMLDVIERIKVVLPKVKKIWQNSTLAYQGLEKLCNRTIGQETDLRKLVAKGVTKNVPKMS
ncbi:hypothetical protein K435DRAFT_663527 [Dendrothele bispora CBS 962.96]|uniref:Uncharacterized protein n=1 Tax=Dendrothele bispora (strain CBS 962.96) TaxID=1314807 RepID=A0A4S8M5D2_DENBC|nr:hypothetical protein K435DRAFT_663527 [Dendrothele bispora CBS 962.96]